MKQGDLVEIIDLDFVKESGENIGTLVNGMWLYIAQPNLYGGLHKMYCYVITLRQSKMNVLLPLESLKKYEPYNKI